MLTYTLDAARARAGAALTATATITRQYEEAWIQIGAHRPCMVERQNAGSRLPPDPVNGSPDQVIGWTVSFAWDEDVQAGDRVQVTGGYGAPTFPLMTVGVVSDESLAIYRQVTANAEGLATEQYRVTIERWNTGTSAYVAVGTWMVQATLQWPAQQAPNDSGAQAATRQGVMVVAAPITPTILIDDWIHGLPWGGALVTAVLPPVADRQDIRFTLQTAN